MVLIINSLHPVATIPKHKNTRTGIAFSGLPNDKRQIRGKALVKKKKCNPFTPGRDFLTRHEFGRALPDAIL